MTYKLCNNGWTFQDCDSQDSILLLSLKLRNFSILKKESQNESNCHHRQCFFVHCCEKKCCWCCCCMFCVCCCCRICHDLATSAAVVSAVAAAMTSWPQEEASASMCTWISRTIWIRFSIFSMACGIKLTVEYRTGLSGTHDLSCCR